jgi:hypothetical protein
MLLARSDVSLFLTLAEAAVHGKTELPGPRGMTAGAWALPGERREKGQCGAGAVLQSYPDPPAQTSDMSARTRCRNGAACTSRGVFRICICGPRSPTAIPRPLSQTAFRQKKSQKDKNDETKRGYCGPWPPPPSAFYAAAGWRPAVGMTARLISQLAAHPAALLVAHLAAHRAASWLFFGKRYAAAFWLRVFFSL